MKPTNILEIGKRIVRRHKPLGFRHRKKLGPKSSRRKNRRSL